MRTNKWPSDNIRLSIICRWLFHLNSTAEFLRTESSEIIEQFCWRYVYYFSVANMGLSINLMMRWNMI